MKPIIQIKETAETQVGKDNNGKTEPEKDKKNEGENPALLEHHKHLLKWQLNKKQQL
ncbi:hypothetical protein NW062_05310 [Mycoplasmopsis cynos]|nr:hypothetical protein NW062_05310 [Mycoplasmopsis cynos]